MHRTDVKVKASGISARFFRRLSQLSRERLRANPELVATENEWIDRGTEPVPKNFRAWNVTEHGLQIHFQEYWVAAYVAGHSGSRFLTRRSAVSSALRQNFLGDHVTSPQLGARVHRGCDSDFSPCSG
jgi:hypothetical protein